VPGGTAGAFPGARPPPGGPSTPSLSQPRARMPVVVTITGSGSPRGGDRPRLTAALRGAAARLRPAFRHIAPKACARLRAKRHPGPSRPARGAAGAGLAIFEPDMSGYRADNLLGGLALTEHRDLTETKVPDLAPIFPSDPYLPRPSPTSRDHRSTGASTSTRSSPLARRLGEVFVDLVGGGRRAVGLGP